QRPRVAPRTAAGIEDRHELQVLFERGVIAGPAKLWQRTARLVFGEQIGKLRHALGPMRRHVLVALGVVGRGLIVGGGGQLDGLREAGAGWGARGLIGGLLVALLVALVHWSSILIQTSCWRLRGAP